MHLLPKPFSFSELGSKVRQILDGPVREDRPI
jgi:hypothetical protein